MNTTQRRALSRSDTYEVGGTDDWDRRLTNALRGLVGSDPKWMIFLEQETTNEMSMEELTVLVEARAKAAILKHYSFMLPINGFRLFNNRWQFTDRGTLPPG